jgi:peptidoglycan/xylan/chitin deacetylase (PgdA/CDA1 family)
MSTQFFLMRAALVTLTCFGVVMFCDAWPAVARPDAPTRVAPSRAPARVVHCGPPDAKQVALTFDDGPSTTYTPQVLDILDQHNIKATFFVLGMFAKRHPELVAEITRRGHLLASHSWSHPKRATREQWRDQMQRTRELLRRQSPTPIPSYYRPPHGIVTPEVQAVAGELGEVIVLYTLLSSDWQHISAQTLEDQVSTKVRAGGIVVLHDGGKQREPTVAALPGIIQRLRARGLQPVRLDTLLGPNPVAHSPCASKRQKGSGSE